MIEFEIVFNGTSWIETFNDFDEANDFWNMMVDDYTVYHSSNFSPIIL